MRDLNIGITHAGLLKLAAEINEKCAASTADGGVEIVREIEHNGAGPTLTLTLSNDDMEGDHIPSADAMFWDDMS